MSVGRVLLVTLADHAPVYVIGLSDSCEILRVSQTSVLGYWWGFPFLLCSAQCIQGRVSCLHLNEAWS